MKIKRKEMLKKTENRLRATRNIKQVKESR